jgi:hypothetical protein
VSLVFLHELKVIAKDTITNTVKKSFVFIKIIIDCFRTL